MSPDKPYKEILQLAKESYPLKTCKANKQKSPRDASFILSMI